MVNRFDVGSRWSTRCLAPNRNKSNVANKETGCSSFSIAVKIGYIYGKMTEHAQVIETFARHYLLCIICSALAVTFFEVALWHCFPVVPL